MVLKLPPPPGTMLWLDSPPQPPKSPTLVCGGAAFGSEGLVLAELPQASLEPHASVLPQALLIAGAAGGDFWAVAVGLERLKTDG